MGGFDTITEHLVFKTNAPLPLVRTEPHDLKSNFSYISSSVLRKILEASCLLFQFFSGEETKVKGD